MTATARGALTAYAVLTGANLAGIAAGASTLANVAQWLLMPTLSVALFALAPARSRLRTATVSALAFSWLGDVVPDFMPEGAAFLTLVGCFLLAQLAYVAGFLPSWRRSLASRTLTLVPYAVALLTLLKATLPHAGPLAPAVVGYGVTLTVMAVLATGVHVQAGIGGALFVVSDSLIALEAFRGWEGTAVSIAVMATYALAQLLLVLGVHAHLRGRSGGGCSPAGRGPLRPAPRG